MNLRGSSAGKEWRVVRTVWGAMCDGTEGRGSAGFMSRSAVDVVIGEASVAIERACSGRDCYARVNGGPLMED